MKSIPEELLYVLMFLAIVLFQYLMKRFGPKEPASDERLEQISDEAEDEPAAPAVSAATDDRFGCGAASGTSLVPPRQRYSRASLLGARCEVQNAVVTAMILGPCRAFESHDIRH